MQYFYDMQTKGFYIDEIHTVPATAVQISEAFYRELIDGQSNGKQIIADEQGAPQLVEPAPSKFHHWHNGAWVISDENRQVQVEQYKTAMREKINALRDEKINGGVYVPSLDKWIDSDATAERNILSVKATFDLLGDVPITWTCADNSLLELNKEKLLLIWQSLMHAKTSNHANALRHKALMEQADDPLNYDFSTGWTTTYREGLNGN